MRLSSPRRISRRSWKNSAYVIVVCTGRCRGTRSREKVWWLEASMKEKLRWKEGLLQLFLRLSHSAV
ncbi:hypothetical protein KCU87_g516, partial [Aureobasidium melanogenum]